MIRSYLEKELKSLLENARNGRRGAFPINVIEKELERREEIKRKRADSVRYPELGVSFR